MTTTRITQLVPTGIPPTKWRKRRNVIGFKAGKYANGTDVIWVLPEHREPQLGEHKSVYWFPKEPLWTTFWVGKETIWSDKLWAHQYLYAEDFRPYLEKEGVIPKYLNCKIIDHGWQRWVNVKNGWLMNRGHRQVTINSSLLEKLYASTTPAGS